MNTKTSEISGEVLLTLTRVVFLTIVLFSVVLLVKSFYTEKIDIKGTETSLFFQRLVFSPNGIIWQDASERWHPGVVDLRRFEQAAAANPNFLDSQWASYTGETPIIAAKLVLTAGNREIVAYYNRESFNRWEPRALLGVEGPASVYKLEKEAYVLINNGEKLEQGKLSATILS